MVSGVACLPPPTAFHRPRVVPDVAPLAPLSKLTVWKREGNRTRATPSRPTSCSTWRRCCGGPSILKVGSAVFPCLIGRGLGVPALLRSRRCPPTSDRSLCVNVCLHSAPRPERQRRTPPSIPLLRHCSPRASSPALTVAACSLAVLLWPHAGCVCLPSEQLLAKELFKMTDTDGSGDISYAEFVVLYCARPPPLFHRVCGVFVLSVGVCAAALCRPRRGAHS